MLTDKDFLRRLDTLWILARKILSGSLRADRKTRKKGSGINFADYAEYRFGDDYRNIDWNIYGRLDELVVKLFEVEEDVTVHVLLDLSRSMAAKSLYARQLAAALGYIALKNLDKLALYSFSDHLEVILQSGHGQGRILTMLRALEDAELHGRDSLFKSAMSAFVGQTSRPGVCIVISDGFAEDCLNGLNTLRGNKHDVFFLHVVEPTEQTCDWRGDATLECMESSRRRNVTISPELAAKYADAVADWNGQLRRGCLAKALGYIRAETPVPFDHVVRNMLGKGGLVS